MPADRIETAERKRHRLFVAVPIPDQAADAVDGALEPWRKALAGVRWTPRANWHVTLRFLGPTSPSLVPRVRRGLADVAGATSSFETRLRRLGRFPSAGPARVLWAGLDDLDGRFADLALAIEVSLPPAFEPETRSFTPHVTVGRSGPTPLSLQGFTSTPLESERFPVGEFVLMRSHLGRPAPVYERVDAYPLLPPAPPAS